jgi:hypothetical protein
LEERRLTYDHFCKIQIDRTKKIRNWTKKFMHLKQNESLIKIGIVEANNHYGSFGPGTVNMFGQTIDMELVTFDNVISHTIRTSNLTKK